MSSLKEPLAAIGVAAGSFGLAFGIGMAVSQAAATHSGATSTTTPASASHPCPNMPASSSD